MDVKLRISESNNKLELSGDKKTENLDFFKGIVRHS